MHNNEIRLGDLSPSCLLRFLLRHLWMLVSAAMIFGMATSLYLDVVRQPVYRATMTYAVTSRETSYGSNRNMTASAEVAAVMTELLETNVILNSIRSYGPELASFSGTIQAAQVGESNLITVTSDASNPESAFRSLSALVDVFPELSQYISQKSLVQVIQNPSVSGTPVNQVSESRTITMGAVAGVVIMAAILLVISATRGTIQTRSGARHLLDANVLAVVGHERKNRTLKTWLQRAGKGLQVFAPGTSFRYAEQINAIASRLEHEQIVNGHKIFLVTGVGENEGKSTIAGNVAAMLAMKGKRVALLDGDMRKPALNRFFDMAYTSDLPLNKLLARPYSDKNFDKCVQRHPKLGLYMLFCSNPERSSGRLTGSDTLAATLNRLREFDFVIVDTPPMGFFTDTETLADQVDASLLVVRRDYTSAWDINDAVDSLKNSSSSFLGCVLNDMSTATTEGHGYGYGYGYGERKGGKRNVQ